MQINRQTYEEFFLLYADGELSATDKQAVEEFVSGNPDLAEEFNLVQATVMHPDESIIFENKELLYRTEEDDRKVIYMRWFRFAAAAAVMIALTVAGWLFIDERDVEVAPVAVVEKPFNSTTDKTDEVKDKGAPEDIEKITVNNTAPKSESNNRSNNSSNKTTPVIVREAPMPTSIVSNGEEQPEEPSVLEKNIDVPNIVPAETALSAIDMPVQAREVETEEATEVEQPVAQYAQSSYDAEPEKNQMIYFANTSLTKKTKLRGVLRKATRYLDRVTSLQ